jgi:hypothetical protein
MAPGIAITALSQTLQNTVKVTRDLGFRYLWVDALCILQYNVADKAAETDDMEAIYTNATLAIVPANIQSAQESTLADRPVP